MKYLPIQRVLSAFLCAVLMITYLPSVRLSGDAAPSAGMTAVTTTETTFHDGLYYDLNRTTRYVGNRTYSVQVEISANMSSYEHAVVRTSARNGYITVQETGYYLLELWGGKGGNGSKGLTLVLVIPASTAEGRGAAGGYVYGKVFLKAGQTLVYNIGTNGAQSNVYDDGGGGVNGDGGTHGDMGAYTVGGGGGYTAIYLFDEGEFDESYVTPTSIRIPETARVNRYLMIAGGGGGGGAGYTDWIQNGTTDYGHEGFHPDGGAGGNVNNGPSMSLLGADYDVPGYVFSGRNGASSGTSNKYVGHGGSNVPGSVPSTWWEQFSNTGLPNDWSGTANPDARPGAGGSGNFRGGAGGAGYAGGSGGLMQAALIGAHVGGGGGGSSFIAAEVNGRPIEFLTLSSEERAYLSGAANQPVGADTGGAVQITYLSGEEDEFYQEALENIQLFCYSSKYFDLLSSSKTTGNPLNVVTNTAGTTSITATGLTVIPASPAHKGQSAAVTLYLRAKEDFMGGNAVEMLNRIQVDFKSPNDNTTPLQLVSQGERCHSHVNVPLNAKMRTHSYTSSVKGKSYTVASLYTDDYATPRSQLSSTSPTWSESESWKYDYISALGDYEVYLGSTKVTGSVAPTETTAYQVQYAVTPKYNDPEVTVGPQVDTLVTGKAVISVVLPGEAWLNDLFVSGSKNLSYNDGVYTFSTAVNQVSETGVILNPNNKSDANGSWSAPVEGWYYLQVWGGNGGNSGSASCTGENGNDTRTARAATGGAGGYVGGYVYLTPGQMISYTIGARGSTGSSNTGNRSTSYWDYANVFHTGAGGGGSPTYLYLDGQEMIIAGGGGGAGASVLAFSQYWGPIYSRPSSSYPNTGIGSTPSQSTAVTTTLSAEPKDYQGKSGGSGSGSAENTRVSATGGSGGAAGLNYRYSALATGYDTTGQGKTLPIEAQKLAAQQATGKDVTTGQVAITLLATQESEEAYERLMGLETDVAFSRYFDIGSIQMTTSDSYSKSTETANGDGSKTVTYTNASGATVAKFTYKVVTAADGVSQKVSIYDLEYTCDPQVITNGNTIQLRYDTALNFSYALTPKAGFLGGNDVPLLAYGQTGGTADKDDLPDCGVRISQGDEFMNLPAADPTDYANVDYPVDLSPYLTVQDKTIHLGDTVNKSRLYTFDAPVCAEDWQDDYAGYGAPADETLAPTQTTEYPITVTFAPRVAVAQKATIVESVEPQAHSLTATVYVEVPVTHGMTNLTLDSDGWTLWGEDFATVITPAAGYLLPDAVRMTVDGEDFTDFTYNDVTGAVTVEGIHVTGPIHITATAKIKTYDIHILYTKYDAVLGVDVPQPEQVITDIPADAVIDWSRLESIKGTIPAKEGYVYRWSFDTEDGQQPTTMPAKPLWVYGAYEKAQYPLTIEYKLADGGQAAPTHTSYVGYGDTYAVVSPVLEGYLPDVTVVSGNMPLGGVTVTVTYTPSVGQVVVHYINGKDNTQLFPSAVLDVAEGDNYTVSSPTKEGYTADPTTVSGTKAGTATETFIVTYLPNTYTVTFDYQPEGLSGATLDGADTKVVEYDNIYGYNAAEDVYDGLPTAQYAGFTFAGWYADAALTQEVTEDTVVTLTADATLYAKWERTRFRLTVRFDFLYEEGDYIPEGFADIAAVEAALGDVVMMVDFGQEYAIDLPAFTGYSAYENFGLTDPVKQTVLTGVMPAQNRLVVITYQIHTYTIRFEDLPGEYVTYSDAATSTEDTDAFNTLWREVKVKHNVIPTYEGEEPYHAPRAAYTYAFTGWHGFEGEGASPVFPAATADTTYAATYAATENIATVTYGSTTVYCVSGQAAVAAAEQGMTAGYSPTVTFRRNEGNPRVVALNDEDTLVFGNTYTGTSALTATVAVEDLTLQNTKGQPLIENDLNPYLSVTVTGSGGGLSVRGTEDVTAVNSDARNFKVTGTLTVAAHSEEGDATAVRFGSTSTSYTMTLPATVTLQATAPTGTAYGIVTHGTASVQPAAVQVSGAEAVGVSVESGTTTLTGSLMALEVHGTETATGVAIAPEGALVNGVCPAQRQQITSDGVAMGLHNQGTLTSLNLKMDVEAVGKAYGLYNEGGTVTVTGIGATVDLRAVSTADEGYGLYNQKDGAAIGGAEGNKLTTGAFAGSSYGLYSEDDSIFAAGNTVYFKGADVDHHLSGVVHTGYEQTDAAAQFTAGEGYYRLAARHTITFITNGGTAVDKVEALYDTPLDPVTTTKRGYTFDQWYRDEGFGTAYTYPTRMPDETLTLHANWTLNQYQYALDKEMREYTVKFYKNTSASDNELYGEVLINSSNPTLTVEDIPVKDPTYQSGSTLYVFNGWYTQRTDTAATYAKLDGDLSALDPDGDTVIHLYAGWESMTGNVTGAYTTMETTAKSVAINSSYTSTSSVYRFYFLVPVDGTYKVDVGNVATSSSSSYKQDLRIYTYKHGTSTCVNNTYTNYGTSLKYATYTYSGMKAGDVIVVQLYRYQNNSTVYVKLNEVPTGYEDADKFEGYASEGVKPIPYNVEMGTVTLPLPENTAGHEDEKFAGWAESDTADRITQITPEMVETVPQWQAGQLWQLYSQWTQRTWDAYQSNHRDFTAFDSTAQAEIRANGTVSVRFTAESAPTEALTFAFAKGLPVGTVLTLIDRSGAVPAYYTYTVTAVTKELSSTAFVKMGEPSVSFSGIATDIVLQIAYQQANVTADTETVSIYAGDVVPEADASYGIIPTISVEQSGGAHSFPYDQEHSLNVTIPSAEDLDLPADYKVFLRVRWDGLNLAPGTVIKLGNDIVPVYGGAYAMLDTGLTVADMRGTTNVSVSLYLPTMVQNEFAGKTFYYELCIAPDTQAAFGVQVEPIYTVTEQLTLQETPSLTVEGEIAYTVAAGETLTVSGIAPEDTVVYLYQQAADGTLSVTNACGTLFETVDMEQDGGLNGVLSEGTFTAAVSADAARGKYYLVFTCGDKYERVLVKVTNP